MFSADVDYDNSVTSSLYKKQCIIMLYGLEIDLFQ